VAARVVNLQTLVPGITHAAVCSALHHSFLQTYGVTQPTAARVVESVELSPDSPHLKGSAAHAACVQALKEWDWRFGKVQRLALASPHLTSLLPTGAQTPEFSHHLSTRFDWGSFDLHLDVHKARVRTAKLYSDALSVTLVDALQQHITGQ
jgi:lipoate-protein ligase A